MALQSLLYKKPPTSYSRSSGNSLLQPSNRLTDSGNMLTDSGNMLTVPQYTEGQYPAAPTPNSYFAPTPDLKRIEFLTQQAAAPGKRKLNSALQRLIQEAQREENPNLMGLLKGKALAGYGEGWESMMGGARREGMGLYAPEYAATTEQEQMNWKTGRERDLLNYQERLQAYENSRREQEQKRREQEQKRLEIERANDRQRQEYQDSTGLMSKDWDKVSYPSSYTSRPTPEMSDDDKRRQELRYFSERNPEATRGDYAAYNLSRGYPTYETPMFDQYIREKYLPNPNTDVPNKVGTEFPDSQEFYSL